MAIQLEIEKIETSQDGGTAGSLNFRLPGKGKRPGASDRMFFTEQLALLIETGESLFGALTTVAKQTENAAVFIPVRVSAAGGSALEIVHPRGHVLRVPAVFDEGALRRVLEVLDQQGDR